MSTNVAAPIVAEQLPTPTPVDTSGKVMNVPAAEADIETKNNNEVAPQIVTDESENYYTVTADKSYLFSDADLSTQRKGYVIKDDIINVIKIKGDFAYGVYDSKGSKSWVLLSTLEKGQNVE